MTIYPPCVRFMKYGIVQNMIEKYYRFRIRCPCFIMMQNERWTLVTMDR